MAEDDGDEVIALIKTVKIDEFPETYRVGCSRKRTKKYKFESPVPQCDPGDFIVERGECSDGSEFLICGVVDDDVCPKIGEDGVGVVLGVEIVESEVGTMAFAECGYSQGTITSDTIVTDYRDTFGSDEDFLLVLSTNCFQTTTECPEDPLTGQKMPLCSKFVSTTETGRICRQESLVPGNAEIIERDMEAYCRDQTTADCRCIDRTGTLIYESLRTGTVTDDGCWWKWCNKPDEFLVPPDIVSATSEDVCVTVRKEIAREINNNLETTECCQIQQNVIYAPDGTTEKNVNCFFRDAESSQKNWFEQYGWWITLLVVAFVVILAVLLIWLTYYRQHNRNWYYNHSEDYGQYHGVF